MSSWKNRNTFFVKFFIIFAIFWSFFVNKKLPNPFIPTPTGVDDTPGVVETNTLQYSQIFLVKYVSFATVISIAWAVTSSRIKI